MKQKKNERQKEEKKERKRNNLALNIQIMRLKFERHEK